MPQRYVMQNGRITLTGDDTAQDHVPPAPATGVQAPAKPAKPPSKPTKPTAPWWSNPLHAVTNELRWAKKQVQSLQATQKPGTVRPVNPLQGAIGALNPLTNLANVAGQYSPVVRQLQASMGPGAMQTAGEGVIALGQKVLAPTKFADPRQTPPGRALNAMTRASYDVLGAKQPEDLTEGQRGVIDWQGRALGIDAATLPVGGMAVKGIRMAGWAGRGLRWGTALGVTHGLGALLQDSTQGNMSNIAEALTGQKVPLAVDPTKDDRVTAAIKSFVPNLVGGEALGFAASGGVRAIGKFSNIARWKRANRANAEHAAAGQKLAAAGLTEEIDGKQAFTEPAKQKPAPVATTAAEAEQALLERYGLTKPAAAPDAPPPAATPDAAAADAGPTAADPMADPWYDPALPEVADVQKAFSNLGDDELEALAVAGSDGGPVLPQLDQVMAARPAPQPRPELSEGYAGVPTANLSELYLNGTTNQQGQTVLEPWSQTIQKIGPAALQDLANPEVSPQLAQKITTATGREWGNFTREDILDGLKALSADGTTILPNRTSGDVRLYQTSELQARPLKFQYKQGVNAKGEQLGNSLQGVTKWDPNAEQVVKVFSDPDPADPGTFMVDGHNTLALAERLGIPTLRGEEINATTVQGARAAGAISNISSGHGTPFDAAKFARGANLKTLDDVQAAGIPLKGDTNMWRQGVALGNLPDDLLQNAIDNRHRIGRYVALGESGLDEAGMRAAHQILDKRPNISEGTFREVLDVAGNMPTVKAGGDQVDLFGDAFLNPLLERSELVATVRAGLSKDRRLFGFATKNADALQEAGGTTIDTAAAGQRVADAQQALGLFDTLKNVSGPVGELLNKGAERVAQGEAPAVVAKQIQREIGDSIEKELANSGLKAKPEELLPPPPEPPAPPAPSRADLEAHAVQRAIANGEVRPTEMPTLDLFEAPQADLDVALQELMDMDPTIPLVDQLPNMPATRQAAADELRLAGEHAQQDAAAAWAAEQAAREAEGYHLKTLEEKKAQGLGQDWLTPEVMETTVMPSEKPPKVSEVFGKLMADMAQTDARMFRELGEFTSEMRRQINDLAGPAPEPIDPTKTLKPKDRGLVMDQFKVDPQKIIEDANNKVKAGQWGGTSEAPQYAAWAGADRPDEKGAVKLYEGSSEAAARNAADTYTKKEIARAVGLVQQARAAAAPVEPPTRPALIAAEVSGAPPFVLPTELSKSSPRFGRNTLQFESDLDRAAYVLAGDKAKGGSKAAEKFREALVAAGFDPEQVAAHGTTVKAAIKAAARDTSAETVVVPVQQFGGDTPRLPLREQQRQISARQAQIDDIQRQINEGGCGT